MDSTKAIPTGFKTYNHQYSTFVEYEYRDHKYEVEYPNDMSYCVTSPKVQHELAQEKIDKMIDSPKTKHGENAEVGLNLFWDYIDGKDM